MRSWFQKRAYPSKVLDEELVKVRFSNQEKTCNKKGKAIPFVVTYHPMLEALNDIIKRNLAWLYTDNELKNLFSYFYFQFIFNLFRKRFNNIY